MTDIKSYNLSSILQRIKSIIDEKTSGKLIWIRAEISHINFHQSGHCYIDLVETKEKEIIAQCKATIWSSRLREIRDVLRSDFDNVLKKGNEILCQAQIIFHEVHGFSINILNVDINFNLGDLEKRKQETINRLKQENIIENNKAKNPPIVIKRIALIASTSTNGYDDFYKQLLTNNYGYVFEITDFPASVQGENAISEICQQLKYLNKKQFDIVAIIRGGGSKLDLDIFNSYQLAKEIALHNLPVYTGIGHENDYSVSDMVASMSHKTPTALGAYIVEQALSFENKINNTLSYIFEHKNYYFDRQKSRLKLNIQTLTSNSISITQLKRGSLHTLVTRVNNEAIRILNFEKTKFSIVFELIQSQPKILLSNKKLKLKNTMELIEVNINRSIKKSIDNHNFILTMILSLTKNKCEEKIRHINNILDVIHIYHPQNILKKGYAIPKYKGTLLNSQKLEKNDELEIELYDRILVVSLIKIKEKWTKYLTNKHPKS